MPALSNEQRCHRRGCIGANANARKRLSFINFAAREINCKMVYYGPGLGGKTTNLQAHLRQDGHTQKGKMISLATETDRTLFFDFLPLDLGTVRGFRTRFHLYTVPGQVFYDASRKLILRGVDGVVFVADSQPERMDANIEAIENLADNLQEHGYDLKRALRAAIEQARPAQRPAGGGAQTRADATQRASL